MTVTLEDQPARMFDVTASQGALPKIAVEMVPLEQLELAPNPRRDIDPEGIRQLSVMLSRNGQAIPCIGRRTSKKKVVIYDGQRRKLAAEMSHTLAGTDGYEDLRPVVGLTVLLLDHEPAPGEVRRLQAQAQARADLSQRDKQDQFADCWTERAGLPDNDRIAMVCVDMGIKPKEAHNLRRQLALPDPIRERVAQRPAGDQLSITLANRLADMQEISPQITEAVAERVTSTELQALALKDLGAFVASTVRDNDDVYAVRLDDGAALDAADELRRAVKALPDDRLGDVAAALSIAVGSVAKHLADLADSAHKAMLRLVIDTHIRDRAAGGGYAWVYERGEDFADAVWLVDPVFMIELVAEHVGDEEAETIGPDARMFASDRTEDEDLQRAKEEEAAERAAKREREREGATRNIDLGSGVAATLVDPEVAQQAAARDVIVRLLAHTHPEVVAYGAGWTSRDRMKPVGDTGRFEPLTVDEIVAAEVELALSCEDPMRGIMTILSRFLSAYFLDEEGVTKSKDLGRERMARRLRDALPGGAHPVMSDVWAFMRPMLSPALIEMHRDRFVVDLEQGSTVDLEEANADRGLDDIADLLGDDNPDADAV